LGVVIGIAQAMILATGINLISDVIGSKGDSGAVVFGIYSFLDKISSGVIIFMLANLPCFSDEPILEADELMIKAPVVGIPILTSVIAAIIAAIYNVSEYILGTNAQLSESKMENQ
jgi:ABC-type transport system involved in cytochrome c biogenesis permease subunit